jgi:polar amino acid transport system substrate-binding protein
MLQPLLLAVATAALLFATVAHAEVLDSPELVLLTENFPPNNMAAEGKNYARDENISGISVDLVREMFKRAGVKYQLTLRFPWQRIYQMALEKPGYGVFSTARLPERENDFKWVGPLSPDDWVLLAKADSPISLNSLEEAKQYKIGAYQGDAIAEHLTQQGLQPLTALRDLENAKKLQRGDIDLWATGDPAGLYLARQEGVSGLKNVLRFNTAQLYLALNKETPDAVVQKLQAALEQMRADGFAAEVLKRYL